MPPVTVHSLGCKVNQAESAWLEDELASFAPQKPLALLFTCAVTASASRRSRQMARRLAAGHEQVVVTGCDVQAHPEKYAGFSILSRAALAEAPELVRNLVALPQILEVPPPPESGAFVPGRRKPSLHRTRAQLKVQDGCDAHCAYCIVPHTRGKPRSLSLAQAQAAFHALGEAGAREVVLSGIHLGRYQIDADPEPLLTLLQSLLKAHPLPRLRLSSLEAGEISIPLLEFMAGEARICPHLHLPLQSGSDRVLAAMGRTYDRAFYARQVEKAASLLPGLCVGADVLVGLPGEEDEDFRQTFELLLRLPVNYLHVFPYSPRPGTKAAAMPGRPPGPAARERAEELRRLGKEKWLNYLEKQKGGTLQVLVESDGLGRAENYCPVKAPPGSRPGQIIGHTVSGVHYAKKRAYLE
ncbi:MAG: MiaB/RimO family radical SAM methylthiotransferase [Desulfarculales bacterium]|nr:MiaB/RimO family radical SAM methylthiotransferase [Desulfarculales bacterium]